jgi:hypothetical protein
VSPAAHAVVEFRLSEPGLQRALGEASGRLLRGERLAFLVFGPDVERKRTGGSNAFWLWAERNPALVRNHCAGVACVAASLWEYAVLRLALALREFPVPIRAFRDGEPARAWLHTLGA